MKSKSKASFAICCLFAFTMVEAVENLKINIISSNVLLSWNSEEGQTYTIQYRPSLDSNTPWVTLTNFYPAVSGTNITEFVHSNVIQWPLNDLGLSVPNSFLHNTECARVVVRQPMAVRMDGSGGAVPVALYPYGFDLSEFTIYYPDTRQTISGADYMLTRAVAKTASLINQTEQLELFEPMDAGGTSSSPDTGFYQVTANGVQLIGLTNGTVLSGVVEIPIEFSLVSTDQIAGITFYGNGELLIGAESKNENCPWLMRWDTAMVRNGTYELIAAVNLIGFDESETNQPVIVVVSNSVSFPNYFTRIFGDQMWIYAEAETYPAEFEVALYADQTNYLGSFMGDTTDGIISFTWDLTDGYGYTFTNESFNAVFNITPSQALTSAPAVGGPILANGPTPSSPPPTNTFAKEYRWSGLGKFVVAYSPADSNGTKTEKIGMMVAGGAGGEFGGVTQTLGMYGLNSYQLSPGNGQGTAYLMNDGISKTNLLWYLWDLEYRNFYYFGHGSPSSIGGAPGTTAPIITDTSCKEFSTTFFLLENRQTTTPIVSYFWMVAAREKENCANDLEYLPKR
jgi:hypothetical protein